MRAVILAGCGLAFTASSAALGQTTQFHMQQIAILGSSSVSANGISDNGVLIGFVVPKNEGSFGFVLDGSTLSTLGNAFPTAIDRAGAVTGFNGALGFLWQNGAFVQGVSFMVETVNGEPLFPVISRSGELAYTGAGETGSQVFDGKPGHIRAVRGLSPTNAIVSSITDGGVIAGYERAMIQGCETEVVFVGHHGLFDELLSPTGQPVMGGFVNNAGQVAYTDGQAVYVYSAGTTVTVALPAGAQNVQIDAINNAGRVVGVYTDGSQGQSVQHAFLYNESVITGFGQYGDTDTVHVAINDHGTMVVSDYPQQADTLASFLVRCTGNGC